MLGAAGLVAYNFVRDGGGTADKTFFYDLSAQKLFTAERNRVPPIRGIDGPEEDAVRAVVISTSGDRADKKARRIAYLEKYSPVLKAQMEQAQKDGSSPEMGRGEAVTHRLVKRLSDPDWVPMSTPEGEHIVGEWAMPGPNGVTPIICSP